VRGALEEVADFEYRASRAHKKNLEVRRIRTDLLERIDAHKDRYVKLLRFLNNKRQEYDITVDFVSKLPPAEMDKHIAALRKKKDDLTVIQSEVAKTYELWMAYTDLGKKLKVKHIRKDALR
jgi:hypothetical protein